MQNELERTADGDHHRSAGYACQLYQWEGQPDEGQEAENQEDYLLSIWYSSDGSVKTYLPNYFEYKYFSTATIG